MGFRGLFLLLTALIGLPAGVTSLASSWISGAGSGWTSSNPSASTETFRETQPLDADDDGRVSKAEHAAAAKALFRSLDVDEDGFVTPAERQDARERAQLSSEPPATSEASLARFDPNQDALCSALEHAAAARSLFAGLDRDTDGYVTMDELRQARGPGPDKKRAS